MKKFFAPTKIVYGKGAINRITEFIFSEDRILVVTDRTLVDNGVCQLLTDVLETNNLEYEIFKDVLPSPDEKTVSHALKVAKTSNCNTVVAIGGGSPIDVGKMVAFLLTNSGSLQEYQWEFKPAEAPSAKLVAIPTTAGSGSEVGNCAVIISRGLKKGIERPELFPKVALIDPDAMKSMPQHITSTTGIDAFTHAYESYVGKNRSYVTDAWAWESMKLIIENLPRAYCNGDDLEARENMALAAVLAGLAKDNSGLGIIHACTDAMGGLYSIPHGLANAVFLPYAMRFNMIATVDRHAKLAYLFGHDTRCMNDREAAERALKSVVVFLEDLNIPTHLEKYLRNNSDLDVFVDNAFNGFLMMNNSRKPTKDELRQIYRTVFNQ